MTGAYSVGFFRNKGQLREYLRVKAEEAPSVLTGCVQYSEELDGQTVAYELFIDRLLLEHVHGGYHYQWYLLSEAKKWIDKTPAVVAEIGRLDEDNETLLLAAAENYEAVLGLEQDTTTLMLALAEIYEGMLKEGGEN